MLHPLHLHSYQWEAQFTVLLSFLSLQASLFLADDAVAACSGRIPFSVRHQVMTGVCGVCSFEFAST